MIVYILTDDQDIRLDSLHVQPKVRSLLIEQGLMFDNAYVTTPVCCPSRYQTSMTIVLGIIYTGHQS